MHMMRRIHAYDEEETWHALLRIHASMHMWRRIHAYEEDTCI